MAPLNDQVLQDLDNLYWVIGDQSVTLQGFIDTFEEAYASSGFPAVSPGIDVPTDFPDICLANDPAQSAFDRISELVSQTRDVKTYLEYIRLEMAGRCDHGHVNLISTLD